jgi:serine/threonine protein kinase/tetratricopeptide (TPR) repeat protein
MQSSAENDERVMTLAAAALRLPAAERAEFLRVACKNQAGLGSEVAEVVEWEERMGDFLRQPLIDFIDLEEQEEPPRPFQPGQAISDRFVILREVGQGGMGVVYEAFDRKRNQRIAIKCAKPGFGRLLSPELEGALKVRHPNICLVNDTHTATTESGEIDFLTMEFIEGETLSARIEREGQVASQEAMEIARQLCAGLAAAHRSGILHRDLKAANVILSSATNGTMRAVITDFGLATDARLDRELDGGTPRYMAPELWQSEKPSKASDVYALGVILYEMATGQQPCNTRDSSKVSAAPLTPPSNVNKGLDARWNKAILPCLDLAPAARPEVEQVLAVFDKRPLRKSPALAVAVLAFVALLAGFQQPLMKLFKPADIRLAILPLQAPPELTDMGNGILQDVADRIKRSQRGGATLVVITATDAFRNNVQTPEQARKNLNGTHALQLTLQRFDDHLAAKVTIIALDTATPLRILTASYTQATAGALPEAVAGEVRLALRLRSESADRISADATPTYDRGLYALHAGRYSLEEALVNFQQAAHLDPHSSLPLAGLAETQVRKFEATKDSKWLDQAAASVQAAEALNPDSVGVRLAAGFLNESKSQHLRALEDYRRVLELEPRNVDAYVRLGRTYDAINMPDKTIESYRRAIALDPNYYLPYQWLGVFYYRHGKHQQAAEQFQSAIDHAPGLFDAYTNLGAALDSLGREAEAEAALNRSLELKETARALNSLGAVLAYEAKDAEAVQRYDRAVALEPGNYLYWLNLGDSQRRLGRIDKGNAAYRKGHDLASAELRQNPAKGYTRAFVAYFKARLGERSTAEQDIEEAMHLAPDDNEVVRCAVLTYQALGEEERALSTLNGATPGMIAELNRHPDLAEFRKNPRFTGMLIKSKTEVN